MKTWTYNRASTEKDFLRNEEAFQHPDKGFFIVSHRGHWDGHPENSLSAIKSAMEVGANIIEIDVHKTKDGELILMHDDTVDRMTNGSGSVEDLTYEQIQTLFLRSGSGGALANLTEEKIPTLTEVMLLVKDRVLINLDKIWDFRYDAYAVLKETDTLRNGLFKSRAPYQEVVDFIRETNGQALYMHMIHEENLHELDLILSDVRPSAIELNFSTEDSPVIARDTISKIKQVGNVWINALDCSIREERSDQMSLSNPDQGWGWIIEVGANIIQTDFPVELLAYLQAKKILIEE
ncbi:glycerophosphodiester phosphodiesterase family protein [Brevibacillus sp. NRS-1366]|uniref:glycerophosphodiester phosphodiesterase family protein n=1 Tax=Brevibacillus sp. NRS-1366 TaxID=3233899 RepID=UPI003D1A0210